MHLLSSLDIPRHEAAKQFAVIHEEMDYDEAEGHCAAIGASLAIIHDEEELSRARRAIEHAGVEKAITAAECTSSGWTWGGTHAWDPEEFPLNTGKVHDHADCTDGDHMYSLHGSSSWMSIWDADMKDEQHPVLCRLKSEGTRVTVTVVGPDSTISNFEHKVKVLELVQSHSWSLVWL